MRLYDNAPDNYHDEMASYFPSWYSAVAEMDAIWRVTGEMFDELKIDILKVINNTFLSECDFETIERLESYLNIKFDGPRTNQERRRFLMMLFAGFGKCSATKIKNMINKYTNAGVEVSFRTSDEFGNHTLYINTERGDMERFYLSDILTMLEKMIPAHIQYTISVAYKTALQANVSTRYWLYEYQKCGTRPDTATVGKAVAIRENIHTSGDEYIYTYPVASEDDNLKCGTIPQSSTIGATAPIHMSIETEETPIAYDYEKTGVKVASESALDVP